MATDAQVKAAVDAFDNVYEAEIRIGAAHYTDNKSAAMRAAIEAAEAAAWCFDMEKAKDGATYLLRGGVYHGAPFAGRYSPSEYKPDEPWICLINDHRLPGHCIIAWRPLPAPPDPGLTQLHDGLRGETEAALGEGDGADPR